MSTHPMEHRWSRRQFMRRAGGAAIALPTMSAILAACSKPGTTSSGGGGSGSVGGERVLARPDNPVKLPLNGEPISADTPIEAGATLQVYNWDAYMYKKVLKDFEDKFGVTIEWTTFNNMEEGIQKLVSGQVKPDVFFPTTDYISRLVEKDLLQPLQHALIPNMESNVWPSFSDPGPWYDTGWQYTVPYAIGMSLVRNGNMDPNTGDDAAITAAKDAIMQLLNDYDGRLTINGTFAKLPEGEFTVSQAWSGDIVGAKWYLPKGTSEDVLGYWYPDDKVGLIGNDCIVVPTTAQSPRLAHEFLNFFLDETYGYENFASWNGYQPPFTSIDPDKLISDKVIPPALDNAVVTEEMFTKGLIQGELSAEVDQKWLDAWNEIQAGGSS